MGTSAIKRELALLVTGKDVSATKTLRGVKRELKGMKTISKGTSNAIGNIEKGIAIAGVAAAGALGYAVKKAGDFEAGMNTINTVALETPKNLATAAKGIRKIFTETGQPIDDLQAAEYDLVSAGIKLKDSQAGLQASVKLGRGAYGTTAEAVDVLTTAVNSYNLKAADGTVATATWTKISDELAQAVADGKVKLSEIAASYAQVAPVAAQAGIGTDEVAASIGFLTAKGVPAAEVMTQMSRATVELLKPNKQLIALQEKTGKNYAKIARQKGLQVALQTMREDAKKAKVPFIQLFGRLEGYKFALQTTGPAAKGFREELDRIHASAGMTNKQFDERSQGLNYQMGILQANVDDAAITIGTALIPQLVDLAKTGTDWLQGHQPEIAQFAKDLAEGLKDAVTWAQSLDWKLIGSSLQAGADAAGTLIDMFANADPWIQQFLIGGFLANKFTGGALADALTSAGKIAVGQIAGRGSSPGNPVWVRSAGGGTGPGNETGPSKTNPLNYALPIVGGLIVAADAKGGGFNDLFKGTPVGTGWTDPELSAQGAANLSSAGQMVAGGASTGALVDALNGAKDGLRQLTNAGWAQPLIDGLYGAQIQATKDTIDTIQKELDRRATADSQRDDAVRHAADEHEDKFGKGIGEVRDETGHVGDAIKTTGKDSRDAIRTGARDTAAAARASGIEAAAAIRDKDMSVVVNNDISMRAAVTVSASAVGHGIVVDSIRSTSSGVLHNGAD